MAEERKSCSNCKYYGWKQPEDETNIQQCAKCKKIRYCSPQCQKEHWFNVHKHHCKYLAELKVLPHSVHKAATCPVCKTEAETGRVEFCRPDNPVLGCPLQNINLSKSLQVSLGELSGQFMTKADETLSLMAQILSKMKDISHTAWVIDPQSNLELWNTICKSRYQCLVQCFASGNPGPRLARAVGSVLYREEKEMGKLIKDIDLRLALINWNYKETNQFRPWDTLKLLANFLYLSFDDLNRTTTERLGLPEMSEDLLYIRVTSEQFNGLWQQVLDTLHGRLVPYTTLVEVCCGGKLRQACYGCLKEVTVSKVIMPACLDGDVDISGLTLLFGNVRAVLCDGPMCSEEGYEEIALHEDYLTKLYIRKGYCEGAAYLCDYCGLPGTSGNMGRRCSRCLTKVYCGEDCRNSDWVVHKMVCREGEEERKRKGGQQARKMKGKQDAKKILCGSSKK